MNVNSADIYKTNDFLTSFFVNSRNSITGHYDPQTRVWTEQKHKQGTLKEVRGGDTSNGRKKELGVEKKCY